MATYRSDCTRDAVHYAAQGGNAWNSSGNYFYSGKDGTYYRSRVSFTTGDFEGVEYKDQRFVVSMVVHSLSSPCGCWGVLHEKGDFVTNDIMNDALTGPNTKITSGCIGQSCTYIDSAATTAATGVNKENGYTFYFSFPSGSLQPNTSYYLYCCFKSGRGSSSGWTKCLKSSINAWVEYTPRWELKFNKHEGVASATGGIYDDEEVASSTATASDGYLLDYFEGTLYDGSGTSTWYGCNGLTTHTSTWTMQANREIDVYAYRMSYTLTYHLNDGDDNIWEQEYTPGMGESLLVDTPERDGYLFLGWYESISDSIYFPGDLIPENWGNRHLSAQWELATYTVYFNTQNDLYMEPLTVNHGEPIFLDYAEFYQYMSYAYVNTTFDGQGGYTPNPEVTTVTYSQNVSYLVDDDGVRYELFEPCVLYKDTTLTLMWEEPSLYAVDSISLPASEKTGHTFLGWYTSSTGGSKVTSPYYALEDCTLYARWEVSTYEVMILDYEDNIVATLNVKYGDPIYTPFSTGETRWRHLFDSESLFVNTARDDDQQVPMSVFEEYSYSGYYKVGDESYRDGDYHLDRDTNITVYTLWDLTDREKMIIESVPDCNPPANTLLSHWEGLYSSDEEPVKVTPTSYFEYIYDASQFGAISEFTSVFESAVKELYIKVDGQYETGMTLVKHNGTYMESNSFFLREAPHWM